MTQFPLNIKKIYEDADLLILDKPFGLVVNRSKTTKGETLQDFLIKYLGLPLPPTQVSSFTENQDEIFLLRSGLAHRLDKDTSGVIVVAKNPQTLINLMDQFKNRGVAKSYVALVHGKILNPVLEVSAPIGRNPKNRFRYAVVMGGKVAQTVIKVQKILAEKYSLVSVEPKTGRTHQIRVHLSAINHPIVGDVLYSPKSFRLDDHQNYGRLMLHAHRVEFIHPSNGEKVAFEANIPSEFEKVL